MRTLLLGLALLASPAVSHGYQFINQWGPMCPRNNGWVTNWVDDFGRTRWDWRITRPDGKEIAMHQAGAPLPGYCWTQARRRFVCFIDKCNGLNLNKTCPPYPYDGCGPYELRVN